MPKDEDTQIMPPEAREGMRRYDENDWKWKVWRDGQWHTIKFMYEDKKYIDPTLVAWGCVILVMLLVLGLGILVGWIIL